MSTANVARDLDLLRRAVGDPTSTGSVRSSVPRPLASVPAPAPPWFSPAAETDEPQRAFNTWFNAVACTDSDNPRDPRAVGRYARLAEPSAPGFATATWSA
jgi:hypothetical protein